MNITVGTSTFNLSPGILEGILESIELMKKDGHEHGFLMCDPGNSIIPGPKCTGNKCSIMLMDCEGDAKPIGSFHSHPSVMSFSMGDYISSINRAKQHPQNKQLLCVSLLDKGLRCKAVKSMPPENKVFIPIDTEKNRENIKPYFSPKVSISLDQIHQLLTGIAWEDLKPAETVIALDEGDVVVPPKLSEILAGMTKPPGIAESTHDSDFAKAKEELAKVSKFSEKEIAAIQTKGDMCAAIEKHISQSGGCVMTPDILPLSMSYYLTKYCATKVKGGLKGLTQSILAKLPPGWPGR